MPETTRGPRSTGAPRLTTEDRTPVQRRTPGNVSTTVSPPLTSPVAAAGTLLKAVVPLNRRAGPAMLSESARGMEALVLRPATAAPATGIVAAELALRESAATPTPQGSCRASPSRARAIPTAPVRTAALLAIASRHRLAAPAVNTTKSARNGTIAVRSNARTDAASTAPSRCGCRPRRTCRTRPTWTHCRRRSSSRQGLRPIPRRPLTVRLSDSTGKPRLPCFSARPRYSTHSARKRSSSPVAEKLRSDTHAICVPSGESAGKRSVPGLKVNRTRPVPSASIAKRS
jgi:hypothetical protein